MTPKLTVNAGVRYEIQTPPVEKQNRMSIFDARSEERDLRYAGSGEGGRARRPRVHEARHERRVAPLRRGLQPRQPDRAPRFLRCVLRRVGYIGNAQTGAANPPFFASVARNSASTAATSSVILSNGFPAGMLDPATLTNPSVVAMPKDIPLSQTKQWNVTAERELPWNIALSASYVGSRTSNIKGQIDIDQPVPGAGAQNPRRPFPTFGTISQFSAWARATYNALQVKAERRYSNGFSFLASYTMSHAKNNSTDSEDTGNGALIPRIRTTWRPSGPTR